MPPLTLVVTLVQLQVAPASVVRRMPSSAPAMPDPLAPKAIAFTCDVLGEDTALQLAPPFVLRISTPLTPPATAVVGLAKATLARPEPLPAIGVHVAPSVVRTMPDPPAASPVPAPLNATPA